MHSSLERIESSTKSDTGFKEPKSQPWIIGQLGSKDSVLAFRTCAILSSDSQDENCESSNLPSTSKQNVQRSNSNIKDLSNRPKCSAILEQSNTINKSNKAKSTERGGHKYSPSFQEKGLKRRVHDSLSSSDNSISSACDDPNEIEADILENSVAILDDEGEKENTQKNSQTYQDDKIIDESEEKENMTEMDKISEMPASTLKITYKFTNTETRLLRKILASHGMRETEENKNCSLLWTGVHIKADVLRNLTPYQRVNHFPRSYELTRKDRLYKNIEKMQHLRGFKHFDIVPLSFMLPIEYRDLVSAHRCGQKGPWIVKPAASSRGRGIFIVNSPEQISQDEQVLVSKYIADPLCIDGHKCDVRLYVAVTSFDPLLIYLYEEGLVRLATVKYEKNVENLWNPCMHLCNYSINKYHSDYIKATASCEDVGHKWTFSALLRHLKSQGCNIDELMVNIEDVIIKSIFSCSQSIVAACNMFVPNGNNCFELYGFDILIDDTLKPWLLEINLSPSLGVDTPLDAKVKASLMTDLLTLVGIPALTPLARAAYDSKWSRFRNSLGRKSEPSHKKSPVTHLSAEETRIVRNARSQYDRKGGFVRIFPAPDSMQKYNAFLDSVTGIPVSTVSVTGANSCSMIIPHNYNQMLFSQLYPSRAATKCTNRLSDRMEQYERTLEANPIVLSNTNVVTKCVDEALRLRKQIKKLIENGNEMSQLQARKVFHQYLECILKRLTQESRSQHEKLILKFITRSSIHIKTPSFIKNPYSQKIISKDRSAMVAKLLGDYLEAYSRDTETLAENFDGFERIPSALFDEFLSHAQENDLESVLTLHTNVTQSLPFLYNKISTNSSQPPIPPIPTGLNGFLKALPGMAPNIVSKDLAKIDTYYKSISASSSLDLDKESTYDQQSQQKVFKPAKRNNLSMQPLKKRLNNESTSNA